MTHTYTYLRRCKNSEHCCQLAQSRVPLVSVVPVGTYDELRAFQPLAC